MNWNVVSLEQLPAQPWRNGGGLTRELLAWPDANDWRVRLSVADVESAGPFSRFLGSERWFAVLDGDGVVLRGPLGEHHLTQDSEPLRFDGGLRIDCSLVGGPTRDFNLMAPPGRGRMQRVPRAVTFLAEAAALLALYTHDEPARLDGPGLSLELPPYHLAWSLAHEALPVQVQGNDALWMEVLT